MAEATEIGTVTTMTRIALHPSRTAADLRGLTVDEVCETHGSQVYLSGDRAFKLRRHVKFAFMDQSTHAARLALANAEVAVNHELAPAIYRGVRDVIGPDGKHDVAVEMRRFSFDDTLGRRLDQNRTTTKMLRTVGERLAVFHADATPVDGGGPGAVLRRLARNAEELSALASDPLSPGAIWSVVRPLEAFAWREHALLRRRAADGAWRDGHGDLRAEHVLIEDGGLQIVDRLEFDPELRADDVAADLAFLLMDLELRGHAWAARAVLDAYRAAGGDPGSDELLAFWAAYRATVSLKVALLRGAQPGGEAALERVAPLLALATRLAWRTRPAKMVVVCGPPASGKSTLAAALSRRTGWPVVSSDVIRKESLALPPTDRAPREAYTEAASAQVYAALGTGAARAVETDGGVIVDATMGHAEHRQRFRAAAGADERVLFVECRAPAAELDRRATARMADPARVSDATPAIAARLRAAWEPLDEIPAADHLLLRTDQPSCAVVERLERELDGPGRGADQTADGIDQLET